MNETCWLALLAFWAGCIYGAVIPLLVAAVKEHLDEKRWARMAAEVEAEHSGV
jgi:hypothetical protein